MENKNHPTIEEIIQRYKDAEEVECLYSKLLYSLSFKPCYDREKEIVHDNGLGYWMNSNKENNTKVYDFKTQQFAKITKYKPEINLSKITPDLIRELNKDPNIHDILVKEGVVKPRIEFGNWIVDRSEPKWMVFYGDGFFYGFNSKGEWFKKDFTCRLDGNEELATPTEVIERLKAEAVKRGFVEGVRIDRSKMPYNNSSIIIDDGSPFNGFYFQDNRLELNGCAVYENGIWSTIINEPKPAYIQVPISEIDNLSSKKLGKLVKKIRKSQN